MSTILKDSYSFIFNRFLSKKVYFQVKKNKTKQNKTKQKQTTTATTTKKTNLF